MDSNPQTKQIIKVQKLGSIANFILLKFTGNVSRLKVGVKVQFKNDDEDP